MSFFNKIVENKGVVLAVAAGVTALGLIALYKSYQNQGSVQEQVGKNDDGLDLQKQINALKLQVNTQNPSLDDVKQILTFSMNFAKRKIQAYSREFKKKRHQYNNVTRKQNMREYMNLVSNGMQEVRNIATNTQAEIMGQLGLDESIFRKYQHQLPAFMQQLMMSQGIKKQGKQMTLEEVKYAIRLQIQYLRNQGEEILQKIIQVTKNWTPQKKSQLPLLLSVVIADGAFEDHPEIDEQAVQAAEMQLQHHLASQMKELQMVMSPIMRKLSTELGGGMGMSMGMGMGMGNMMGGMDEEDPFNGMSMEQIQQKLQELRVSDPAAFEHIMQSMYG